MKDELVVQLLDAAKELLRMSKAGHVWCRVDLQNDLQRRIDSIEKQIKVEHDNTIASAIR